MAIDFSETPEFKKARIRTRVRGIYLLLLLMLLVLGPIIILSTALTSPGATDILEVLTEVIVFFVAVAIFAYIYYASTFGEIEIVFNKIKEEYVINQPRFTFSSETKNAANKGKLKEIVISHGLGQEILNKSLYIAILVFEDGQKIGLFPKGIKSITSLHVKSPVMQGPHNLTKEEIEQMANFFGVVVKNS
ncbi:MAG: hypothetical protein ABID38_07010 [Candidatus Diapherotrites archaeon]